MGDAFLEGSAPSGRLAASICALTLFVYNQMGQIHQTGHESGQRQQYGWRNVAQLLVVQRAQ